MAQGPQNAFSGAGTIAAAGDTVNITINGVLYQYTAVAGDVGSWNATTQAHLVSALNLIPGFASLYVAQAGSGAGFPVAISMLSLSNSTPFITATYTGAGSLLFAFNAAAGAAYSTPGSVGGNFAGGDSGAYTTVQSTGGGVSPNSSGPPIIAQGGFVAQVGNRYIMSTEV